MVVICEAQATAAGDSRDDGSPAVPLLIFAVISERNVKMLSGPSPRGRIGVSFDSSASTFTAFEKINGLAGGTSDAGRLLMLQPSNSYFAYRPILRALQSPARQVIPFADTLLPPTAGSFLTLKIRLFRAYPDDTYDLTDLATASSPHSLGSVSMLDQEGFPMVDLLEHTTLDEAQLEALHAALSREVALIQGPPGTGKTFVGAKAVQLLLTNRDITDSWSGPIMCVCLTNHALDQFLCDLLGEGVNGIWGMKLMATRDNFRDANGTTATVVDTLLRRHAPGLEEAILNSNKTPVRDEDGFQTVGKMPQGVRDWLAGKNPAQARRQRSRKGNRNIKRIGVDASARKRREQQRALDRRLPSASAPGASSATPLQLPDVEDSRDADKKRAENSRDQEDVDATGQDKGRSSAGESRLPDAGTAWLDVTDLHHDGPGSTPTPDLGLLGRMSDNMGALAGGGGGGPALGQTWSLASSGKAAMANGEEWGFTDDGSSDGEKEKVEAVAHDEAGGYLEAKGTHLQLDEPPAPLPHGSAEPLPFETQLQQQPQQEKHGGAGPLAGMIRPGHVLRYGRGRGHGYGRGRCQSFHGAFRTFTVAVGPDDAGGRGFAAGRGKRVDEKTKAGTSLDSSDGEEESSDDEDSDGEGEISDGEDESPEAEESNDEVEGLSITSSEGKDGSSTSGSDDDGDVQEGNGPESGQDDAACASPATERECSSDFDTIISGISNGRSVWTLSQEERRTLCRRWQQTEAAESRARLASHIDEFFDLWERHNSHKTQGELAVLQEANVVGMTTTGVAMHQDLVEALGASIVVVEEAAEVMEAHILTVLTESTQHLILIGDHLQLRPKAEVYRLTKESRNGFDLDVSMFERLVEERRVPVHDLATQRRMRPEIADLIRPAVYPNLKDAPHVLRYPSVKGMRRNLFFWDHAIPEDSSGTVASSKTNRHEAKLVAGLVLYLLKQGYTEQGDITVLTPYLGQLFMLKDVVGNSSILHVQINERDSAKRDQIKDASGFDDDGSEEEDGDGPSPMVEVANKRVGSMVRMATIDNFQGEESKIIILSLVRSNRNGDIGFLRSSNRVNVALSRAQHGMYIIGNAGESLRDESNQFCTLFALSPVEGMLESRTGTMWSESVIPSLRKENALGPMLELQCARHEDSVTTVRKYEDFASLAGDGGCSRACSSRLPCGHTCVRRCHPDDPHHLGVHCSEPCPRLLQPCDHPCQRLCGDECGPCLLRIKVVDLPCGHQASNARNTVDLLYTMRSLGLPVNRCLAHVTFEVPGCGHSVEGRCTDARAIVKNPSLCTARCGQPLACGHSCAAKCGRCTALTLPSATTHHATCTIECGRYRSCGHQCQLPCHEGRPCPPCPELCALSCEHSSCSQRCVDPCTLCAESCTWHCPHEAGSCRLPCGAPCVRLPCDIRCERKLLCGHQCPSVCGEDCPGSEYCRECCGPHTREMTQVVDMLEFTTLKEHDPSVEPIVVLGCGHAYTLSTLDAFLGLASAYAKV
ncbi:unnamed protein product, partial [Hapterophycus canaliculatus]